MTTAKDQLSKGDAMQMVSAALTGMTPFAEFVERVLALWRTTAKNPTQAIRNELAYSTAQYGIVYFDDARQTIMPLAVGMKGVRFRHPVRQLEAEKGMLSFDASLIHLLGRRLYTRGNVLEQFQLLDEAHRPLPVTPMTYTYVADGLFGKQEVVGHGFALADWFRQHQVVGGDAILLTIADWAELRFNLAHEPATMRQSKLIAERNRALVDILYQMLEQTTNERLRPSDAVPAALMRLPDPQGYPGDPWLVALAADKRMSSYGIDIRYATPDDRELNALWLGQEADEGEEEAPLLSDEQAQQVYRFKCELKHRKGLWRVIDIRGDATLADFNNILVSAFNHDFDHMGGFWRLVRRGNSKRFREIDLGSVDPLGDGEAADVQIASIGLEPGDRIKYVFDFGDWIEHTLTLDAIFAPSELDTAADLPRVVTQNRIRHHYCTSCAEEGKKSVAIYLCGECSDREQRPVYLCEACVDDAHEDHYIQEILY